MANLSGWIIHKKQLGVNFEVDRLVEEFEKQGVDIRVVNPKDVDIFVDRDESIDAVKDKLYSQQILGQSNLPVPKTMLVKHPIDLELVEKNLSYPMVVKTLSGSYGAGVFLVEDRKQFRQLMKMAEITKPSYNIILQEFIQIDENIEWLGGECARLLHLDIAGVDLLFNDGNYVICEVNSAPGFKGMEEYTNKNIAVEMVNYVIKKIGG